MKSKRLYFITIFLLYIVSMQPWFMWHFSYAAVYFVGAIISFLFYNKNKSQFFWGKEVSGLFVVFVLGILWLSFRAPILVGVGGLFCLVTFYIFLGLPVAVKHDLLLYIKKGFAIILLVSLVFYFLHVAGVPLPSVYSDYGLYGTDNYFFFVLTHDDLGGFNRFRCIFGEPGFMTLGLIPLFFAGKFDLRDKYNVILLLAELVSFSLAGYAILIIIILYFAFSKRSVYKKHVRIFLLLLALFVTGFVMKNQEFFEIIDTNILARVAINENTGTIAGYNRSTEYMDEKFDQFKNTPDIIWGIGANEMNLMRERTGLDEGGGNAGFKIYTYMYGIIGVVIFVLFYFLCYWKHRSLDNLIYLACLLLLLFQNSYVDWYCVTIGSYLCFSELRNSKKRRITPLVSEISNQNGKVFSNNSSL